MTLLLTRWFAENMRTSLSIEKGYSKDILLQILSHSLTNSLACDAGGINFSRVRGWRLSERERFKSPSSPFYTQLRRFLAKLAHAITIDWLRMLLILTHSLLTFFFLSFAFGFDSRLSLQPWMSQCSCFTPRLLCLPVLWYLVHLTAGSLNTYRFSRFV